MRTQKVIISFDKYTDANLTTKAEYILQSLIDSVATFATPVPALASIQTVLTAYIAALNAAVSLDRNAIALKNQQRALLIGMLKQLGMYVMTTANGDITALINSGFTLTKLPEPNNITTPGNVLFANGVSSGSLVASVPAVKGAISYLHNIVQSDVQPTDSTLWESTASSKSNNTYANLQAGKQYWARVIAIGRKGQIAYGPANSTFVQ